jgi:hypothetical protein
LSVSATSAAASVQFDLGAGPIDSDTPAVVAGVADGSLELFGVKGTVTIMATDCNPTCDGSTDSVVVSVDLPKPSITSPKARDYVRSGVDVKAAAPGGTLRYSLDGNPLGSAVPAPFDRRVSLSGVGEGAHTISVQQCNSAGTYCNGYRDSVTVIKDTKAPRRSNVTASSKTVFPVNDNYKDSTRLSARVNEDLAKAKVEIRKAGGPVVRTFNLGRESAGLMGVTWNGRKTNGDMAPKGRYTYRFIGTDRSGLTGKSDSKRLTVSDKRLVRKTVTKTVSAKGSIRVNASGACSGVYKLDYPQSRYGWKSGAGYYSRSKCNGSATDDTAVGVHRIDAPGGVRHYSVRIDVYGGGAFRHAGPGILAYMKKSGSLAAGRIISAGLGWHAGRTVNSNAYLKSGKMTWAFGTVRGNWFDVKEFRLTFKVGVLR